MNEIPVEALELIGREKVRSYEVTRRDIKRFAQAIDDPNPKFRCVDPDVAAADQSVVAPPLFCQMFVFEDAEIEELPPDGSPVEINIPLPAEKTVGGSSIFEVFGEIKPGDRITAKSRVVKIFKKEGRSGALFFISVETAFYNQHNTMVSKETATYIKK